MRYNLRLIGFVCTYVHTYSPLVSLTTLYKNSWISHTVSWKWKLQIRKKRNFFPTKYKLSATTHYNYVCTYIYVHCMYHNFICVNISEQQKHFPRHFKCTYMYMYVYTCRYIGFMSYITCTCMHTKVVILYIILKILELKTRLSVFY